MLEFEEYKVKLNGLKPGLDGLGAALKLEDAKAEIAELEAESAKEGFWNDVSNSQKVQKRIKQLQQKCEKYDKLQNSWDDLMTICEMALEENDDSMLGELEADYAKLETELEAMRLSTLLSGEYDANNVILSIHPGAGGTEAQDWAQMLYRMYTRWAERHDYTYQVVDYLDGDEAGIKSATIMIQGENAYGHLKSEHGVHRLVRVSPFDANARRHTSFSSLDVSPILEDDQDFEINMEDVRIDTYRAGGAGGQHVNRTDSAVRMTHIPTGIVAQCQNERSQVQNREVCLRILKSRLLELREREKEEQMADIKGEMKKIEWGSQIRSYVFQPYTMVKDHRTGYESGNVDDVMDGNLDGFITAYLKMQ